MKAKETMSDEQAAREAYHKALDEGGQRWTEANAKAKEDFEAFIEPFKQAYLNAGKKEKGGERRRNAL